MNYSNENNSFLANSSSKISSINSFSKHSTLMDYLVKKLEARIKTLPKTRAAIGNIYHIQDLIENKKEMVKHFFEIEDDLRQGVDSIKALLAQNRDLTEQLESTNLKISSQEIRSIGDLNIMKELNEQNNHLMDECNIMRKKFSEIESKSIHLRQKISEFEYEFKIKQEIIEDLKRENKSYISEIERLCDENVLLKLQLENFENESQKSEKIEKQSIEKKYDDSNYAIDLNSVIVEKQKNKKLIEEKIKNHFISKNAENEGISKSPNDIDNISQAKGTQKFSMPEVNENQSYSVDRKACEKINDEPNFKNENLTSKIIMKAIETEDNINLLNKKIGIDFMEKLLSQNVSEEFLRKIEDTLEKKCSDDQIEGLPKSRYHFDDEFCCSNSEDSKKPPFTFNDRNSDEDKIKNNPTELIKKSRDDIFSKVNSASFFKDLVTSKNITSHRKRSNSTCSTKYKSRKVNFLNFPKGTEYKTTDSNVSFQSTLRNYRNARSPSNTKVFVNYTNPHGNFFDDTLQRGGKSKLDNMLIVSK